MIMLSGCPGVTFSHGRKKLGSSSNVITCEYLMPSTSTERERKAFFCSNYLTVIPYSVSNSILGFVLLKMLQSILRYATIQISEGRLFQCQLVIHTFFCFARPSFS